MLDPYVPSRSFEVPCVINPWTEGHSANTNDSLAYGNGMVCKRRNETYPFPPWSARWFCS
jgi:hypothetical protein